MTGANDLLAALSAFNETVDEIQATPLANAIALPNEPLEGLLAQCEAMQRTPDAPQPVRIIQHFACTGGTLLSRALSLQPNTMLLSEIDPLSTLMVNVERPAFAPSDLIHAVRHTLREVDERVLSDMFLAGLDVLHKDTGSQGLHLVLRDHAHSHYCTERDPMSRPSLRQLVSRRHSVRALVTLRHPLDSFLSLVANGWHTHMQPPSLEEYARRYQLFLDDNRGVPQIRYEEFLQDPSAVLASMCRELELPYDGDSLDLLSIAAMSGDSGRKSARIAARPRREIPDWIRQEAQDSTSFKDLCQQLGYDAALDG